MTNQTNNEKSKNGKRLALILVALLLIAAVAFGAFTYSRYISEINGTGSAPVAKWGYTATISAEDMGFSNMYKTDSTAATEAAEAVISSGNTVVAPNSSGSVTFTVGGTAEVNAKITYAISAVGEAEDISDVSLTLKNGDASVTYNPIKWTLNDGETNVVDAETLADVQSYLTDTLGSQEIKAGTELTATTYTLSWAWAFDNGTLTAGDSTLDCDDLDTLLGKLAAQSQPVSDFSDYTAKDASGDDWIVTGYSIEVGFVLSITIEQINTVVA